MLPRGSRCRRGGGLRFAILLGRGIASRAEGGGIFALAGLKETGDAKIDQVDMALSGQHDVGRLEIAKDDGRIQAMEIFQDRADLDADRQNLYPLTACSRRF